MRSKGTIWSGRVVLAQEWLLECQETFQIGPVLSKGQDTKGPGAKGSICDQFSHLCCSEFSSQRSIVLGRKLSEKLPVTSLVG